MPPYIPSAFGPSPAAYRITPDDSEDLPQSVRMLRLGSSGSAGDVKVTFVDDTEHTMPLDTGNPIGPVMIKKVHATGTTATNIDGFI